MTRQERLERWMDGLVSIWDPSRATERRLSRKISRYALSGTWGKGYEGARSTRMTAFWQPGHGSADADLLTDLPTIRERSRSLERNTPHGKSIIDTMALNVVGNGILPQSTISMDDLDLTEDEEETVRHEAEDAFAEWAEGYCDAMGQLDFWEMQDVVIRGICLNGDIFLVRQSIVEPGRPFSFCWAIVEADRVATPLDLMTSKEIRAGVEMGSRGQPVAYHILRTHPGDDQTLRMFTARSDKYDRVPAYAPDGTPNVLHLFLHRRPGQSRGVPSMESILKTAVVKDRYEEAYLASALMAACQSGYLKTPNMAAYQARMGTQNSRGAYQEEMAPAQFRYLAPGEEVGVMSPAYPNGQYDPYQTSLINQFAAGTGLPSAWISKDFSRYNYSSQRAADLQGRKVIRRLQRLVVKGFCLPSWGLVQEEAYLRGRLSAPAFYDDRRAWTSSMWIPPGWEWVSPSEEAKASRDSMEIGTSSEIEECATQGKDWEQVLKDQARVKRKREELDLADWRDAEKPAPPAPVIQQVKPDSPDDTPEADKPPVADRTEDEVQEVDK